MELDRAMICESILDSLSTPVVFVDGDFIIRYMNRYAKYHYHQERGYGELVGHSLFNCHNDEHSEMRIRAAWERMKKDGKEAFVGVNLRNQRLYMQPVRDSAGTLIGFFERFELNLYMEKK